MPGTSPTAQQLTACLPALGAFSVVIVAGQGGGPAIEKYQGARLQRVAMSGADLRARFEMFERAVKRQLESEQPVIVHLMDPFAGYSVFQQKPRFGYKVVFDARSLASAALLERRKDLTPESDAVSKILKREAFCLAHSDRVLGTPDQTELLLARGARQERLRAAQDWDGAALQRVYAELGADVGQPAPPPAPPAHAPPEYTDEITLVDVPLVLSGSVRDPWLCQLMYGFCPPEHRKFARPPPATTFPGKTQDS